MRILRSIIATSSVLSHRSRFAFSGLPPAFFRHDFDQHIQMLSLSQQEITQLSTINAYTVSVSHLQKNSLSQSLLQLQYALAEARNKYPFSINLHACLMNRQTILLKLLSRKQQLQKRLEQLYLISLSAKGHKSIDTIKNLVNYLICLTVYNPKKCKSVLAFLQSHSKLPEYLLFFDALNDIRDQKLYDQAIRKLQQLPDKASYQQIFKYNNLAYLTLYALKKQLHPLNQYPSALQQQSEQILTNFLKALAEAQENPSNVLSHTPEELKQLEALQKHIANYLNHQTKSLPTAAPLQKKILKNPNSHIISMNIASLLFELNRTNESFYFLQLSLERAVSLGELERVGIAMILLGRCYYLQKHEKWQTVYLDLLHHNKSYPKYITKEALSAYSSLLVKEGRLYQAEGYLNQSFSIDVEEGLEGLILPSYDFSF